MYHQIAKQHTSSILATIAATFLLAPVASRAQSSGSFSFGRPKAEAAEETETVSAIGYGASVDEAKKDAVRNAIKQTVGELVGAETLVENDELVKDKILTLSNAVVTKTDYGEPKATGDGLWEVAVQALVKKGRLNQALEEVGIARGTVSGGSLAASLFSGKERVANAEKFFAERLKGFPGNVVEAVMLTKNDGSPDIEVDSQSGHVFANVGVRVNMENYAKFTQALCELLGQVCLEQEQATLSFKESSYSHLSGGTAAGLDGEEVQMRNFSKEQRPHPRAEAVAVPVVVATPSAKKIDRMTWPATIYYLDPQMFQALSRQIVKAVPENQIGHAEVVLKDADNDPVCSKRAKFGHSVSYRSDGLCYNGDGLPLCAVVAELASGPRVFGNEAVSRGVSPLNSHYAMFAPVLRHDFRHGILSFSYSRELNSALALRIDLGAVEEEDLASVAGYEIKVEYK